MSSIVRTLKIAVLAVGLWNSAAIAGIGSDDIVASFSSLNRYSLDHVSLGRMNGVGDISPCCHKVLKDECRQPWSQNTSKLRTPRKPELDPSPQVSPDYINIFSTRFNLAEDSTSYSDLPQPVVTAPIYLTTLRLRL